MGFESNIAEKGPPKPSYQLWTELSDTVVKCQGVFQGVSDKIVKEKNQPKEYFPDLWKEYSIELKRVVIFCDHANVFHNLLERKIRIDYKRLREILTEDYHLVTAVMFMGFPKELFPKKKRLLNALEKTGWYIVSKPITILPSGKKIQNGVDEEMLNLITQFAREDYFEKAIIISGDQISIRAIQYLHSQNKLVEVWSFERSLSHLLKTITGERNIYYLDEIIDGLIL